MPKIIVLLDGVVTKEVQLTKGRTSLGRRPYNAIVISNLAVSGEHAVLQMSGTEVHVEDLNSTNGTYVNGKAVKKQLLQNSDTVEIGKYKIKYVDESLKAGFEKTMMIKADSGGLLASSTAAFIAAPAAVLASGAVTNAAIRVMSGASVGCEVALVKVVTTIGKVGVAVAAINRRQHGFVIIHVEGVNRPSLNGSVIGAEPVALKNGDLLELAGTQMQFVQQ